MLKVEVCAFSGLKIYPGHGKRVTRADGKTQIFLSSKCERNHALKRNPRKVSGEEDEMGGIGFLLTRKSVKVGE